jgi:hypothetical protein
VRHDNSRTLISGANASRGRRGAAAAEAEPWPPTQWCYQDPQGAIHGPFQIQSMRAWWRQGYLSQMLPMRPGLNGRFRCLHEFFPDKASAFAVDPVRWEEEEDASPVHEQKKQEKEREEEEEE